MEIEIFEVEGIRDEASERRVSALLEGVAGVTSAAADRDEGSIEVTYDPSLTTVDALRTVIESAGYIVVA